MNANGTCMAVLPDGKKVQAKNCLDFTVPDKKGLTNVRFWIPAQKAGSKVVIKNISLRKIGE